MIDDENDDGKELWFKRNQSRTCSVSYVEYDCGGRELFILDNNCGSVLRNPTFEQVEEKLKWLESRQ